MLLLMVAYTSVPKSPTIEETMFARGLVTFSPVTKAGNVFGRVPSRYL